MSEESANPARAEAERIFAAKKMWHQRPSQLPIKEKVRILLKMQHVIVIAAIVAGLIAPSHIAGASASRQRQHGAERLFIRNLLGSTEVESILLRPDGTALYGHGGRMGTRHVILGARYQIRGHIIILHELNQHVTELAYSGNTIRNGAEIWRLRSR